MHVQINAGGRVVAGPRSLVGSAIGHLASHPSVKSAQHHPPGHEPPGARSHPQYAEHEPPPKPAPLPGKPYARLHGAPQTRQEQPKEGPEPLTKEQAHAGLQQAHEQAKAARTAPEAPKPAAEPKGKGDTTPAPAAPGGGFAARREAAIGRMQDKERRSGGSYRVLGTSDDQTTCEICGKKDLKKTVALHHDQSGEVVRAGSDCAAELLKTSRSSIEKAAQKHGEKREEAIQKALETHPNQQIIKNFASQIDAIRHAGQQETHAERITRARQRIADLTAEARRDIEKQLPPDKPLPQATTARRAFSAPSSEPTPTTQTPQDQAADAAVAHQQAQAELAQYRAGKDRSPNPWAPHLSPPVGDAKDKDLAEKATRAQLAHQAVQSQQQQEQATAQQQTAHEQAKEMVRLKADVAPKPDVKPLSPPASRLSPGGEITKEHIQAKVMRGEHLTREEKGFVLNGYRMPKPKPEEPAAPQTSAQEPQAQSKAQSKPALTAPQPAPGEATGADLDASAAFDRHREALLREHPDIKAHLDAQTSHSGEAERWLHNEARTRLTPQQKAISPVLRNAQPYPKPQLPEAGAAKAEDERKAAAGREAVKVATRRMTDAAVERGRQAREKHGIPEPTPASGQTTFGAEATGGSAQHKPAQPGDPIQPERAKPVGQLGMFGEHKPFEQPKPKSEAEQAARGGQKSLFGSSLGNLNERQPAQSHAEHEAQLAKRSTGEQGARDAADRERFTRDLGAAHPADRADWSHLLASTDGRVALKHMLNLAEGHLRLRVKEPQNALGHLTRLQRLLGENDMNTARGPQTTQLMHHPLAQMTPHLNRVSRMAHEAEQRRAARGLPEARATVQTGFDPAANERLKQDSERAHAAAKAAGTEPGKATVSTAAPERPKDFKKASEGARPHEMSEGDFIAQQHTNARVQAERSKAHFERELAAMTPKVRAGNRGQMAEGSHRFWSKQVANWPETPTEARKEESRKAYAEHVKTALSKGHPVPEAVIAQRPEFRKAQDARARYDKGRHTSFANDSVAVNRTGQQQSGYKVKRQDGKPIPAHQVAEIDKGMQQIQGITGPLTEHMRAQDLTIAHLNGKHPFMSAHAAAMYHGGEQTISHNQGTLAHEMFHYLDHHAGKAQGVANRDYTKEGRLRGTNSYMSDRDAHMFDSRDPGARALHRDAVRHMTDTRRVEALMKPTATKDLEGDQKKDMLELKSRLGPYWREPREVFARLAEQYVAHRLGQGSIAADAPDYYHETPGWWSKEHFERMKPEVERQIGRRLEAMGLDASHLQGESKAREAATSHVYRGRFVAPIAAAAR